MVGEDKRFDRAATDEPPIERVERQLRQWKLNNSPDFVPDPATSSLGPGTYRPAEDAWSVIPEDQKLRVMEGDINWTGVGHKDKEALLARHIDFSKISCEQLNAVYEIPINTAHEPDERPARRLFDNANFAQAVADPDKGDFYEQLTKIRSTTRDLIESIKLDSWPRAAAVVDFGLDSQQHYEALYYPIRHREIAPVVLDAAMGHGEKLTELARNAPSNPHRDISFHTSWDDLLGRDKPKDAASERRPEGNSQSDYQKALEAAADRGSNKSTSRTRER